MQHVMEHGLTRIMIAVYHRQSRHVDQLWTCGYRSFDFPRTYACRLCQGLPAKKCHQHRLQPQELPHRAIYNPVRMRLLVSVRPLSLFSHAPNIQIYRSIHKSESDDLGQRLSPAVAEKFVPRAMLMTPSYSTDPTFLSSFFDVLMSFISLCMLCEPYVAVIIPVFPRMIYKA